LGGGGTDMGAGLKRAADLAPSADVIVVLTDGETGWPDAPPQQNPRATYIAVILRPSSDEPPEWIRTIYAQH
ncbi:MAG: VWA-like domain-containing protein, partial [Actinomycetes bacterium]